MCGLKHLSFFLFLNIFSTIFRISVFCSTEKEPLQHAQMVRTFWANCPLKKIFLWQSRMLTSGVWRLTRVSPSQVFPPWPVSPEGLVPGKPSHRIQMSNWSQWRQPVHWDNKSASVFSYFKVFPMFAQFQVTWKPRAPNLALNVDFST